MVNEEAFWSHVHKQDGDDGHWLWTGAKNAKGYGILEVDGKTVRAHRVSYEMGNGVIPDGKVVGHKTKCATTSCVRPSHLELVTNEENIAEKVRREANDVTTEFLTKLRELLQDRGHFADGDLEDIMRVARGYAGGVISGRNRRERATVGAEPDADDVHVPSATRSAPYKRREELPETVREALPPHAQDVFMAAYNDTINEDASNDAQAAAVAWAAVKNAGYAKDDGGNWHRTATEFVAARPDGRRFAEVLWDFMAPPDWVQVLPKPGRYSHPVYGSIDLDTDALHEFVANFEERVYNQDLPVAIDFEHDKGDLKDGGAVGYIEALRPVDGYKGGVEAKVRWTERGEQALENDAYRYFSPEWYDVWKQAKTGKTFRNILVGGALTTRPFFKADALRPLAASEDGQWRVYEKSVSMAETKRYIPQPIRATAQIKTGGKSMVIQLTEEQAALVAEGKAIELTEDQMAVLAPKGAAEDTTRRFAEVEAKNAALEGQLRTATERIEAMRVAEERRWADGFVASHRHALRGTPAEATEKVLGYKRELSDTSFAAYCADLDGMETALAASEMFVQRSNTASAPSTNGKLEQAAKRFVEQGMLPAEARAAAMRADPTLYDEADKDFMAELKAKGV